MKRRCPKKQRSKFGKRISGSARAPLRCAAPRRRKTCPRRRFAGQQSTFLNVSGADNVVRAVQACWASLFEARAIFYREDGGYRHLDVGLAVPVQRMVQSEKSGVMFTVEPVTSDPSKITIEAVYGLGEGIVSGEISPDLYMVDKASLSVLSVAATPQRRMFARSTQTSGAHEGANAWLPVSEALAERRKLTDDEVRELAAIGRQVEEHYGHYQDIEWAFEGGHFYLTQARPVTTMQQHDHQDVGESRPRRSCSAANPRAQASALASSG